MVINSTWLCFFVFLILAIIMTFLGIRYKIGLGLRDIRFLYNVPPDQDKVTQNYRRVLTLVSIIFFIALFVIFITFILLFTIFTIYNIDLPKVRVM